MDLPNKKKEDSANGSIYELLMKFSLQCRLDGPDDITLYAIEYFTDMKNKREQEELDKIKQNELRYMPPSQLLKKVDSAEDYLIRHEKVRAEPCDIAEIIRNEKRQIEFTKTENLKRNLSRALRRSCLFRSLAEDLIEEVVDAMTELRVDKGDCVLEQGLENDTFYVIERGAMECLKHVPPVVELILIGTYENEDYLGELALLHRAVNDFSVYAITNSTLWMIERHRFRRIMLKASFANRDRKESLLQFVPMLQNLRREERLRLAETMQSVVYPEGSFVYRQGDTADGIFIIETGVATLAIRGGCTHVEINRIGPHGFFGELGLISHKLRPMSVIAQQQLCVEFLSTQRFEETVGSCLGVMRRSDQKYHEEIVRIFGSATNVSELRDELIAITSSAVSPKP